MSDNLQSQNRIISVVVVEDHSLVRAGMKEIFSKIDDIRVVGEATECTQAIEVIKESKPDVVLVDIQIPGGGGIEVIKSAKTISSESKCLVVSAYDDYAYIVAALEAGAKGYILKTAGSDELINAIRSVFSGATVVDDEIAKRLRKRWQTEHKAAIDLTTREIDVLRCLAKGLSNKQAARELNLGIRTVEGYVSNVLAKLNVQSRTEAAIWAVQNHVIEPTDSLGVD